MPAAADVHYLTADPGRDARQAAKRDELQPPWSDADIVSARRRTRALAAADTGSRHATTAAAGTTGATGATGDRRRPAAPAPPDDARDRHRHRPARPAPPVPQQPGHRNHRPDSAPRTGATRP